MKRPAERRVIGDGTEKWHGTLGGYTTHHCLCPRCTAAWSVYWQGYVARKPEQLAANIERQRVRRAREQEERRAQREALVSPPAPGRRLRPEDAARLRGAQ